MAAMKSNNSKQASSVAHSYTVKIIKKPLPNTKAMVDDALIELHTRNGLTIKQLISFITGKYIFTVTTQRNMLIKKYLRELFNAEEVINVTGKGLSGHFKLANKKKYSSKPEGKKYNSQQSSSMQARSRQKVNTKKASTPTRHTKSLVMSPLKLSPTVSEMTTILADSRSTQNYKSMFDTPLSSLPVKKRISGRRI